MPGETHHTRTVGPVDPEKMKLIAAILRDPNPIHWDPEAFPANGSAVNQGPATLAYLVDTVVAELDDPGLIASIDVTYSGQVCAGDEVQCRAEQVGSAARQLPRRYRVTGTVRDAEVISATIEAQGETGRR